MGGNDCGELFRYVDWSASPLGEEALWPVELRTLVNVMLGSLQPMLIVWGPEQIALYNDGYAAMCGKRHPAGFGQPLRELWPDIWDEVEPIISAAYAGKGTSMDDIEFTMHRNGYPEETHFSFSYTPVRDPWGTVLGMFCACAETTQQVISRREQNTQHERLRQVFELSPGGIATLVGPQHVFEFANDEYHSMIGVGREIIGKPVAEAVSEVVAQGFIDILDGVYSTGKPYLARGIPIDLNRGPSGESQSRHIDLTYQAIRGSDGSILGILVQAQDVTERLAEEKHERLISHELGHRLKNQLAMVQAIASQTLRTAKDMLSAKRVLTDRIAVLSASHDTIIQGGLGTSKVHKLVDQMVAIYEDPGAPRFTSGGPNLRIGSRPSLSLSLILHELATNATKYGGLSVPGGSVDISWRVLETDVRRFEMVWAERGGPAVVAPTYEGSGTRLIKAGLAGAANGKVDIQYQSSGLRCVVSADLATFQQEH